MRRHLTAVGLFLTLAACAAPGASSSGPDETSGAQIADAMTAMRYVHVHEVIAFKGNYTFDYWATPAGMSIPTTQLGSCHSVSALVATVRRLGSATIRGSKVIDGVRTVAMHGDASPTTWDLYMAADNSQLPVRLTTLSDNVTDTIDFSQWNATPPPGTTFTPCQAP